MVLLAMVSTAYLEAYSYHGALRETTGGRVVVESREAVGLLRLGLLVRLGCAANPSICSAAMGWSPTARAAGPAYGQVRVDEGPHDGGEWNMGGWRVCLMGHGEWRQTDLHLGPGTRNGYNLNAKGTNGWGPPDGFTARRVPIGCRSDPLFAFIWNRNAYRYERYRDMDSRQWGKNRYYTTGIAIYRFATMGLAIR